MQACAAAGSKVARPSLIAERCAERQEGRSQYWRCTSTQPASVSMMPQRTLKAQKAPRYSLQYRSAEKTCPASGSSGSAAQAPSRQVLPEGQALQVAPPLPQASSPLPVRQTPSASQQPTQVSAPHFLLSQAEID